MTKPKVGISMLYCLGNPFKTMIKEIPRAETKYIEIVDDGFHTLNVQRVTALKEIKESYELEISVHAPFADINIASPSKPTLTTTLKRLKKSITHARALDAYLWIFHPGMKTGISSFYPGADWLQNLKTIKSLLQIADDCDVKIAIENVPEPFPCLMKSVNDFQRFYSEINDNIGFALDVGHANVNGQLNIFLKAFANRLVHMHLSDNDGSADQHLGIGWGTVDWKSLADHLRKIAYDRTLVIESIEHTEESLKKLKSLFV